MHLNILVVVKTLIYLVTKPNTLIFVNLLVTLYEKLKEYDDEKVKELIIHYGEDFDHLFEMEKQVVAEEPLTTTQSTTLLNYVIQYHLN